MQQTFDRVFSTLAPNRRMSERHTDTAREEATQLALKLLENYQTDLARRPMAPADRPQS